MRLPDRPPQRTDRDANALPQREEASWGPQAETGEKPGAGYRTRVTKDCLDPQLIEQCANRILESDCFARSPQARRFLRYVVEKSVLGGMDDLKAYTIGVSALGVNTERSSPETNARMQASRVRRLLKKYYEIEGKNDVVLLTLPSGTYSPRFSYRGAVSEVSVELPRIRIERFENVSAHPLDEQFRSALSESLLDLLVDCRHLKVVDDVEGRGDSDYTLAGKITRSGQTIRVSCHLRGPEAGESIWSDRFNLELSAENLLQTQDEVASRIASRLADPAMGAVAKFLRSRGLEDPRSRAVAKLATFLSTPTLTNLDAAVKTLGALVPSSEAATVHAAYACSLALYAALSPEQAESLLPEAEEHARAAVSRDSSCSLGHLARALVHYHFREEHCALRELSRAVELDRPDATSQALSGLLLVLMGHYKEGLRLIDRSRELLPNLPRYFSLAYGIYYFHEVGDPARALSFAEGLDLENSLLSNLLTAACLCRMGRSVDARSYASRAASSDKELGKNPTKRLTQFLFLPAQAESLGAALSDAGLGSPARTRKSRPAFKVSLSSRPLPQEIRIGVLQSLSGTMALSEAHLVNAAMMAVEEINRDGGVLGRPVRALVEDGASDPEIFGKKAHKLVKEDGVSSVFGCWTSSSRKAVLPVVERHNALLWYPLQYEGLEKSRHVIYTGSCLNQQIEPAVRWAQKREYRSCFLIGSDYVFPRTANRLIRALVESAGGHVLGESYHPLGAASFEAVAKEIARLKPEIVYNTINGSENVQLFHALAQAGLRPTETPVLSFSLSELELAECAPVAQGQLACWSYFQSMTTPGENDLVSRFRGRYGQAEVLSDPSVTAYSQVHLWKKAVEKAQSLDTDALLAHLTGLEFQLGDESYEISENHHVTRRAVIGRVEGAQFRVIWSSPEAIAPEPWLGVDQTDFFSREMILGALQALPEMAERSSMYARRIGDYPLGRNAT
jgi:urea ABC transporter urea binding protein